MIPYTVWILVAWTALFIAWFAIGVPWGPGAPVST
jgi:aminobenzoyl-glutamate transport protein